MHLLKGEMATVLVEMDTLLPCMGYDNMYGVEGSEPDIATVGPGLTTAQLAKLQQAPQADILDESWDRDHRIRCLSSRLRQVCV